MRTRSRLWLLAMLALCVGLIGCAGDDGADGYSPVKGVDYVDGEDGADGSDGADGQDGQDGRDGMGLAPAAIPALVINNLQFGIAGNNYLTATFDVTDGTDVVTGLTTDASTMYLAGLVPGSDGDSDQWQYWTGVNDTSLVEQGPGTYVLTSNKTIADVPAGTNAQRGVVRIALAGYSTAVRTYDFTLADPATPIAGGKDVVNDASCKECHGYGVTIHGYGRNNVKVCVICHSPNYNADIAGHEADMVTMIHQIHTNKADVLGALHYEDHGENWETLVFPGTILKCDKCHNTVAQADNWKARPTMDGCDSCHTTIAFDGSAYTGIKGGVGHTHDYTSNMACAFCHTPAVIATQHVPAAKDDASQRPITAAITGVVVDGGGGVTVSFSVQESGVPKVDLAAGGAQFTLAKLVPATEGTPSYWQSYLSQIRTKDTTRAPVIQGRTEAAVAANWTNNGNGTYTYRFQLLNAEPEGDIRNVTHAHNRNPGNSDYGPDQMVYPVSYEPMVTHRVAIILTGIKSNAFYDFVPSGNGAETRNIVGRAACSKCHGDSQLHAGFDIELCVGCHTQESYDPYSGPVSDNPSLTEGETAVSGSSSVELERLVHKVHMGKDLEKGFRINTAASATTGHIYDEAQYPGGVPFDSRTPKAAACMVCHDELNAAMTEADRWRYGTRACGSCHDGDLATAHINSNTYNGFASCTLCHAPGALVPVDESHYGAQR